MFVDFLFFLYIHTLRTADVLLATIWARLKVAHSSDSADHDGRKCTKVVFRAALRRWLNPGITGLSFPLTSGALDDFLTLGVEELVQSQILRPFNDSKLNCEAEKACR